MNPLVRTFSVLDMRINILTFIKARLPNNTIYRGKLILHTTGVSVIILHSNNDIIYLYGCCLIFHDVGNKRNNINPSLDSLVK